MTAETAKQNSKLALSTLAVVIPVFNEEEGVVALAKRLGEVLSGTVDYHIVFVNDGSSDNTADVLKEVSSADPRVKYILLSKNCGHQTAMRAGLENVDADCVVTMDGDFQHPPEFILTMLEHWRKGAKVVLTRRTGAEKLSGFKRSTSSLYYRLINALSDVKLEEGAADFRLVDRAVLKSLKRFSEHDIFYRGIIPLVGYKVVTIDYELQDRRFGKSKYSLRKMLHLGIKGVLSSSTKPLRLAMAAGFAVFISAVIYFVYVLFSFLVVGVPLSGWTSVILTILILGASQLFVMGIIGEYIGQLLVESRRRPSYFIAETNLSETTTLKAEPAGGVRDK